MDTNQDNIKEIVDKYFEEIDIPLGLEERISNKIDLFAKEEQEVVMHPQPSKKLFIRRVLSLVAALALIITSTIFLTQHQENKLEIADTCTSAEEAYQETQLAFIYLAKVFEESASKVNVSSKPMIKSREIINKYIK